MSRQPLWRRYLRFWGSDHRADLDDEIAFHLGERTEQLVRAGMTPAEADREARRRFGNTGTVRVECEAIDAAGARMTRQAEWFDGIWRDMRLAARQFRRSPAAALAAMVVLALGIGIGATVFALARATLLQPLPGVHRSDQLMELVDFRLSYPMFQDLRREAAAGFDMAASAFRTVALEQTDRTVPATALVVSGNWFAVVGATLALGRPLTDAEDVPGQGSSAVISHRMWAERFGSDRAVLGEVIRVNGYPVTIIGVTGTGFRGLRLTDYPDLYLTPNGWKNLAGPSYAGLQLSRRGWGWLLAVGRVQPGVSPAQAVQVANPVIDRLGAEFGDAQGLPPERLQPVARTTVGAGGHDLVVGFFGVLTATVVLVLALTCANLASLTLARGAERRREVAVRVSLGAGRRRLIRQLLVETLTTGLIGGIAAIGVLILALGALRRMTFPGGIPLADLGLRVDWQVVAVALLVALITGLGFGLVPALSSSRLRVAEVLRDGRSTMGRRTARARAALLVAQVSAGLVLLIGAGLFGRSLMRSYRTDLGFRTEGVASIITLPGLSGMRAAEAQGFYDEVLRRVEAIPGVTRASWAWTVPFMNDENRSSFEIVGEAAPEQNRYTMFNVVSPGYWEVLGIPIRRGRGLEPGDRSGSSMVAVVSERFVREFFPSGEPIGKLLRFDNADIEIVGVCGDIQDQDIRSPAPPKVYLALAQATGDFGSFGLLAHATDGAPGLLEAVRRELSAANARVPQGEISTLRSRLALVLAPERLGMFVVGSFAVLATLVAAIGVAGSSAQTVTNRRQEIAIRLALGASPGSAVRSVLTGTILPVLAGLVIGVGAGVAGARFLRSILHGTDGADPGTLGLTLVVLVVVSGLSAALPARHVLRRGPMDALRSE